MQSPWIPDLEKTMVSAIFSPILRVIKKYARINKRVVMNSHKPASTSSPNTYTFIVPETSANIRIDAFLAHNLSQYSRTACQKLISRGHVSINGEVITRPSTPVSSGDTVLVTIPEQAPLATPLALSDDLGVTIVYDHPDFMIISKPAGLVVHTSSRSDVPETTRRLETNTVTLVDWLLTHFKNLADVGSPDRPGIIHRLDKDTSGLMIIAKNPQALATFGDMFKDRKIHKTYWAVAKGHPPREGTIELAIDRHPTARHRMTHISTALRWKRSGRDATTHFKVLKQFEDAALLELKPVTGRTHQIRVHCAAIKHPLLGDAIYGSKSTLIARQALHAYALEFEYQGKQYKFTQQPPEDFEHLIKQLEK
jgi:23S rRNA pseudouridine1911/1915/1917 synthase